MTNKRLGLILSLVLGSTLGLRGSVSEHSAHLSDDLFAHRARLTTARTRVIVHGDAETIDALANRHHLQILRRLSAGAVLAANSAEIADLAADASIDHLSGDPVVRSSMSISNKATQADLARAGTPGVFGVGAIPGVTGKGVGVAVIDSGISPHLALTNKVVTNISLVTGDPSTADAYGHGTHIAGIIAGSGAAARNVTTLYDGGIAPDVQLVNVRVLGADGSGLTSDVIAGIEWAIANRARYGIRVINLSLGHPVEEPAATDPLCEAVADAVHAGIVVVAAAGNGGVADDGSTILGGIVSPGNSPLAITVGALNTWATPDRSDDTVATYSSRGPTRYDMAVKPDLAAPGDKIVSLEADGAYLGEEYSYLHKAGSGSNAYMQLSGTSMAAPMVSGGVALLLQGTPSLVPAQVKLALQMGATFVKDGGLMSAGAGSVNFWASRQIAASGLGGQLLSGVLGGVVTPASGVAFWDSGSLASRLYSGVGLQLLSPVAAALAWLNPSLLKFGDLNLLGLSNPLVSVVPKWLLYGQIAGWTSAQSIMWGDTIYSPQGQSIMWGDSATSDGTSIMWGDAIPARHSK